ncbi:PqqD family protein [Bacillus sp. FSL W7-1360]
MSKYKKNENVNFTQVDGEAVLLDVRSGKFFGLDKMGVDVWQLIDENKSFNQLVESIVRDYEISLENEKKVGADITSFLKELESSSLILKVDEK